MAVCCIGTRVLVLFVNRTPLSNNNAAENLEWSEHMGNYGMKRRYTKKTVETPKFEVVAPATVEEKPVVPVRKKVKVFRRNPFSAHSYRLGTLLLQR